MKRTPQKKSLAERILLFWLRRKREGKRRRNSKCENRAIYIFKNQIMKKKEEVGIRN
jgi:hypothetical protein